MKQFVLTLVVVLLFVQVVSVGRAREKAPVEPEVVLGQDSCEASGSPNLLDNPSFEGEYSGYVPPGGHPDCPDGTCNTAQMDDGWTPYWRSQDSEHPDIKMPEYKPATLDVPGPVRVHSGKRAQQYFTFYATHEAGFYQQVTVTPGAEYCFSIWGHSWSSQDDDPNTSDSGFPLEQRVGIDPMGGTDWQSPNIVWSHLRGQYNEYDLFSVQTTAQAGVITVFTYSKPWYAAKHNDVYWDDASLTEASAPSSMSIFPDDLLFLAKASEPETSSGLIDITFNGDPSVTWTASVDEGGTLTPQLSANSGNSSEDLTVTVNSTGYSLGIYTATLTITSTPAVSGSPVTVPVTLHIVEEVYKQYLPFMIRWE